LDPVEEPLQVDVHHETGAVNPLLFEQATDEAHVRSIGERERAVAEQGGRVASPLEREEFDAMRAAMAYLERLERYRRRAWSRQRRAFQRFMEIESAAFETGRAGCSNPVIRQMYMRTKEL
jgi:hypothetical protein